MTTNWMVDALRASGEIDAAVARAREISLMNGFELRRAERELDMQERAECAGGRPSYNGVKIPQRHLNATRTDRE